MSGFNLKSLALEVLLPCFFALAEDVTDVVNSGTTVVIAPHEDDDVLSCGATIALARRAGQTVKIIFVTDGSASSVSDVISPVELANRRRSEAISALKILGCEPENVIFLDIPDNTTPSRVREIASLLLPHLQRFQPQQVFSPYGIDPHPDHAAVAAAVELLWGKGMMRCRLFEYPRLRPMSAVSHFMRSSLRRRLRRVRSKDLLPLKRKALAEHASQCENLTGEVGWQVLSPSWLRMFFQRFELFVEKEQTEGQLGFNADRKVTS